MFRRNLLVLMMLALGAAAVTAQNAHLAGTVAGVVFDAQTGALRPLLGVPGASYLGQAMASGLKAAAVSPDGRLALAVRDGHLYLLSGLEGADPVSSLLEEQTSAERMAWNSASTAAVVYGSGGRLLLWRGLDGTPEQSNLGEAGGKIAALAVDNEGTVLAGIESEEGAGVYRFSSGGEAALVAGMAKPSALAFSGGGDAVFAADRERQEILEIRNYRDAADVALFANEALGVADPVGLAVSARGHRLIVASASGRSLATFDLASRAAVSHMELDFEPNRVERLGKGSLFLLNTAGRQHEALQVLEDGPSPAVYFVPAPSAAEEPEAKPVEE